MRTRISPPLGRLETSGGGVCQHLTLCAATFRKLALLNASDFPAGEETF